MLTTNYRELEAAIAKALDGKRVGRIISRPLTLIYPDLLPFRIWLMLLLLLSSLCTCVGTKYWDALAVCVFYDEKTTSRLGKRRYFIDPHSVYFAHA